MSHALAGLAGAALAVLFVSRAEWAVSARAWLRRHTIARLGF